MHERQTRRILLRIVAWGTLWGAAVPLVAACEAVRGAVNRGTTSSAGATTSVHVPASPILVGPVGRGQTRPGPDGAVRILMTEAHRFDPPTVVVTLGTTVEWVNAGASPHTATGDPSRAQNKDDAFLPDGAEPWDTGDIMPTQSYARVFDVPGFYVYFCVHHEREGMVGRLVVSP